MASYSEDQIVALKAALARGALSVQVGEERVTYNSREDMQRQLERMQAEVAGSRRISRVRQMTPRFSRGL